MPTLTQAEIDAIKKDKALKESLIETFNSAAAAKDALIAKQANIDSAFKKFFDYYNDDIIGKYDAERKAINGVYPTAPPVEADIVACAEVNPSGRITPTMPVTDVVRISDFDGTPTSSTAVNELQHLSDQLIPEGYLVSGIAGTDPTLTLASLTDSVLTPSSTTLKMIDAAGPMAFVVGDKFVVYDAIYTQAALVKVTAVTDDMGGDPPYKFTLGIQIISMVGTSISAGSPVGLYSGFTNLERTNKVTTNPGYQVLMNLWISELQAQLNLRLSRLSEQLTAINANLDPDGTATLNTAKTEALNAQSFLTAYLLTTDISDTGLAGLDSEHSNRVGFLGTRVTQIVAAYTGQTQNYYNKRYEYANNRANTSRGSLRIKKQYEGSKQTSLDISSQSQDVIDAYNDILP